MIHEYDCKRCGKHDWHYADDCQGEHSRYCSDCENTPNTFEQLMKDTSKRRKTLKTYGG